MKKSKNGQKLTNLKKKKKKKILSPKYLIILTFKVKNQKKSVMFFLDFSHEITQYEEEEKRIKKIKTVFFPCHRLLIYAQDMPKICPKYAQDTGLNRNDFCTFGIGK